jgi:dTDP-4-dehydrorhamnose reductase
MTTPLRVLVTGAGGQVGVDLMDVLQGSTPLGGDPSFQPDAPVDANEFLVIGLTHHDLDIADEAAVHRAISTSRPDVIVHLAAYTAVDRAESDDETCTAVNDLATGYLSDAAAAVGAHFIMVSTDYVFDGRKGSSYVETDETNPLSVYGRSKRDGERRCRPEDSIVRTSWVMGVRGKNVLHVIADRATSGLGVRFVSDQAGTVTCAADLARALVCFIRTRPGGIWHVANVGTTTWFDVADFAGRTLGRGDDFAEAILTSELDPAPKVQRPERSDLDTTKFSEAYAPLPHWQAGVARLLGDRDRRPSVAP